MGYLLGATSRDEQEETDRHVRQQSLAERRRQQQLQQQQLANHSYYPAQYGSRQQQQHTEVKEATDHSTSNTATPPVPVKYYPLSPAHPSQPASASSSSSSSSDPSILVSAHLPTSSSAPHVSDSSGLRDQLDDATLCKVCYDRPLDAVLFPCRHQCCCYVCSEQLSECPVCRAPFTSAVKIYRS